MISLLKVYPAATVLTGHLLLALTGFLGIALAGRCLKNDFEENRQQAILDTLTGIPNRRSFTEQILKEYNRSLRNHLPISVIMGDIDHFKGFNDTYGHVEGDKCLQLVARAINSTLKRPGDFCARYGGEEFIIILPETPRAGAMDLAESIRKNVLDQDINHAQNFPLNKVTISLGVASISADQVANYEELVKLADAALYDAKGKGRNRIEARDPSGSPD